MIATEEFTTGEDENYIYIRRGSKSYTVWGVATGHFECDSYLCICLNTNETEYQYKVQDDETYEFVELELTETEKATLNAMLEIELWKLAKAYNWAAYFMEEGE